jgi:hypothetical protein
MTWTIFHIEDPDFWVRSIPDDIQYGVHRASLELSEVFRTCFIYSETIGSHTQAGDMFSCCDKGSVIKDSSNGEKSLDLDESAEDLTALLRLLHTPPLPPKLLATSKDLEKFETQIRVQKYDPSSVIPLPLLPLLFALADKYLLAETIVSSLCSHLLANGPLHPLQVYGFATLHGLNDIADRTSKYLLHPPLASYSVDEIKVIPSVEAYHKLVLLHQFRITKLREAVLAEEVFPHGYGECAAHKEKTISLWGRARKSLAHKIEAGAIDNANTSLVTDDLSEQGQMLPTKCQLSCRTSDRA